MKQFHLDMVVRHSAKEVWRVMIKNFQVTLPAAVPQHYTSIEYLDGPPLSEGGLFRMNYNPDCFVHFDYAKLIWEHIDHDKMSLKARVVEGGYLGKHVNPTLVYNAQIMDGPEPNTSITKWIFEYDDAHEDTIGILVREEVSMFGEYLESHINDANPSQIA